MKKLHFILIFIFCFSLVSPGFGQAMSKADREKAEKNTAPFSLIQLSKKEVSHYVLKINVLDGKMVLDEKAQIIEVPGKLPNQVGRFGINILDRNGERIAKRRMIDPLLVWTSEEEKNEISYLKKGTIFIPLPKNKNIAQLEFYREKEVFQKINVGKLMEEMLRRRG